MDRDSQDLPGSAGSTPLVSARLAPEPAAVGQARRHLRGALQGIGRHDLIDDAVLVANELVTNALVHAGTPMGLEVVRDGAGVRVTVSDDSRRVPQPRRYGAEAGTGRGLHLVQKVSEEWGYTLSSRGKTVWFRISQPYDEPSDPAGADRAAVGPTLGWDLDDETVSVSGEVDGVDLDETGETDVVRVRLLQVPLLVHAAWREQAQAMLRDVLLAALAEHRGEDGQELVAVQRHAATTNVIGLLDESLPEVGPGFAPDEAIDPAVEPLVTLPEAWVPMDRRAVHDFATLQEIGEIAKDLAERGKLMTPPPLPEIRAFRQWFCAQVRDQAQGLPAEPWRMPSQDDDLSGLILHPQSVESHGFVESQGSGETPAARPAPSPGSAADGVHGLIPADSGVLTADAEGRILGVSRPAAELLGYENLTELVGARLVRIVPERYRQAHLAGMTLYLVTGRQPILGHRLHLPALCRDGSERPVTLTIRAQDVPHGRPVLVTDIAASD